MLQSTYSDHSRVDLELPEGLLGLGCAATSPDSPLNFRQAQSAAERSGVAGQHCWSLMLPTSARVAQDVLWIPTNLQNGLWGVHIAGQEFLSSKSPGSCTRNSTLGWWTMIVFSRFSKFLTYWRLPRWSQSALGVQCRSNHFEGQGRPSPITSHSMLMCWRRSWLTIALNSLPWHGFG